MSGWRVGEGTLGMTRPGEGRDDELGQCGARPIVIEEESGYEAESVRMVVAGFRWAGG